MTKIGLSIFNVANYVQDMHRNIIRKKVNKDCKRLKYLTIIKD